MPVYTFTTFDDPLATNFTFAHGLNGMGQIVGTYTAVDTGGSSDLHGFFLSSFTYSTIDDPFGVFNQAWRINDAGQIVGSYVNASGTHGYLYSGGTYTRVDDPFATSGTNALGINDLGQIVGSYFNASGSHGFLYSGGTYTRVDDPFGISTVAYDINNAGQIAGAVTDANHHEHGFLCNGTYTTLDDPRGLGHQRSRPGRRHLPHSWSHPRLPL